MNALLSIAQYAAHDHVMPTGIGSYIKAKRAELGLNQTEAAERAEMTRSHLAVIESGKVALPNADLRRRIARALGVSHLDLLVAAGEITEDEVESVGVRGVAVLDPVRADLLERLGRIRLTSERVRALDYFLDLYLGFDTRSAEAVEELPGSPDKQPATRRE